MPSGLSFNFIKLFVALLEFSKSWAVEEEVKPFSHTRPPPPIKRQTQSFLKNETCRPSPLRELPQSPGRKPKVCPRQERATKTTSATSRLLFALFPMHAPIDFLLVFALLVSNLPHHPCPWQATWNAGRIAGFQPAQRNRRMVRSLFQLSMKTPTYTYSAREAGAS